MEKENKLKLLRYKLFIEDIFITRYRYQYFLKNTDNFLSRQLIWSYSCIIAFQVTRLKEKQKIFIWIKIK